MRSFVIVGGLASGLAFVGAADALVSMPLHGETSFSAKSGQISVSCEEWANTSATFNSFPAGKKVKSWNSRWLDTANITQSNSSVTVENDGSIKATGTIRGLDKQWVLGVANCPGGGHGELELYGTYE